MKRCLENARARAVLDCLQSLISPIAADSGICDGNQGAIDAQLEGADGGEGCSPEGVGMDIDIWLLKQLTPRDMAAAGPVNLFTGVPLLGLISEKWIRKLK
jgi:hypothetical protein